MSNMGYCRFQNTLRDLEDCQDHLMARDLDDDEKRARERLIELCVEIARDLGDLDEAP
jgi:hypothetical protein